MPRKRFIIIGTVLFICLILPSLNNRLIYKRLPDQPVDCIVLLHGDDFARRKNEAQKLIAAGYSHAIYLPVSDPIYGRLRRHAPYRHLENTHIELMAARNHLIRKGYRRAVIVSSPYHMRRVKLICDRLFDDRIELFYASPAVCSHGLSWLKNREEIKWVITETAKIAWFLFYSNCLPEPASFTLNQR